MRVFTILTYIGAAIGGLFLLSAFGMEGAPQEAAAAAMAMAFVGIPYCITSVLQRAAIMRRMDAAAKLHP